MVFADVETLVAEWLRTQLDPAVTVRAELPDSVKLATPLVCVERFGGSDRLPGVDRTAIDVDVFADGNGAAKALIAQVRELLRTQLPGHSIPGATVSQVSTILGEHRREWDDSATRRRGASFEIVVHNTL